MNEQAKFAPKVSGPHRGGLGGTQDIYEFDNGYSASVVRTPFSYGGDKGLYELAVMAGGHLVYDTPITDDVLGHLSDADVQEILSRIAQLPPRESPATQECAP